jgi:hypothetical protein
MNETYLPSEGIKIFMDRISTGFEVVLDSGDLG